MKRTVLFILFFTLIGSISAQKPFASYVHHEELLADGYDHFTKKMLVFDPEGLVIENPSSRMTLTLVDHYLKSPYLILVVNKRVINNIYLPEPKNQDHSIRVSCVQSPVQDFTWVSGSFEQAVNAAIAEERSYFDSPGENIADYVHPSYSNLYELSENVIAALRTAYAAAYTDLNEINIEIDETLNDISEDFCCTMDACNEFNHESPCLGSLADRIEAGIGTNSCWSSIGENIGAAYGYSDDETAILHVLYNMMYFDENCCDNSHRELILKCTFTTNTKLGFGIHHPDDDDPYDILMAWHFVTLTYNSGCISDTPIGTPTCLLLPLQWKSLRIENENCQDFKLIWETSYEVDIDRFEIEKASQNLDFTMISSIPAKNGLESNQYHYLDLHPGSLPVYYRIKAVDNNGLSTYSSISHSKNSCLGEITIFPNPVKELMHLQTNDPILEIEIIDIHGVKKMNIPTFNDQINVQKLEAGMYFLKVKNKNGSSVLKFIKN